MAKSVMGLAHEEQKKRPVYKAVRKVNRHYELFPRTPGPIAQEIKELHQRGDQDREVLEKKHAEEFTNLLERMKAVSEQMKALKTESVAMSLRHRDDEEAIMIKFATVELDLLEGRIKELPEDLKPTYEQDKNESVSDSSTI